MESGKKIPNHLENPLDNYIIDFGIKLNPHFHKMGFTPNLLTFISAVFGVASIYSVYTSKYILAGIFYFISYSFDCFDGNFARTYNQVTEFGDFFDHIKDWVVISGLISVIYFKKEIQVNFKITALVFLIVFTVLCQYHMSCQEDHYHSNNFVELKSGAIDFFGKNFTNMCKDEKIKYTRYFGCGTLTLYIVLVLVSMQLFRNQIHPKNH